MNQETSSKPSGLQHEISRRRTFAIISHPDAGKTTLTEKLLLYGGAINLAGSVRARRNQKRATSDWMAIEQERGISVTSTVLQFEYQGYRLNLLDTPGHEDFSEDTYRTLMAADAAILLMDAGKGVEPQTEKLYRVCQMRHIPIFTFMNKMDRPSLEPLALLDEMEKKLDLTGYPVVWPIGNGPTFCGVVERSSKAIHFFDRQEGGAKAAGLRISDLNDPSLPSLIGPDATRALKEELEMLESIGIAYDAELVAGGVVSPVFFGSAMTNFGVQLLLDYFLKMGPAPASRPTDAGTIEPADPRFTAFVFKTQANMDPRHRDRVAFLRVCSGKYEENMEVLNSRTGKTVRLNKPREFFGRERESTDEAFPGDILGLMNNGQFLIGDTLCQGKPVRFSGIPRFSPEHFGILRSTTPAARKQFNKGMEQLLEEGAVQALRDPRAKGMDLVLAAVGPLQFEVMQYRLKNEYQSETTLEMLPYKLARWVAGPADKLEALKDASTTRCVEDLNGHLVALFRDPWSMESTIQRNPELQFSNVAPLD